MSITPQEFSDKWQRRTKAASEDVRRGVEAVTESPTAAAAAKQDKWAAKMAAAETQKKWADNLKAVDLNAWKSAMLNKGLGRIAAGVDGAASDMADFASQLLPAVERARGILKGMPDLTIEDSINRASTFIREMSKFKRK